MWISRKGTRITDADVSVLKRKECSSSPEFVKLSDADLDHMTVSATVLVNIVTVMLVLNVESHL